MKIFNQTKNTCLAQETEVADTLRSRMIGLLSKDHLNQGEALIITRCNSIHMFFMKFAIDVVFVDKDNKVVGCIENIKPFHLSPIFFGAAKAIEAPVGTIASSKTEKGDQLKVGE